MFLTILAGLAATFAYFRIGHWVGRRSLEVWTDKGDARSKRWLCWSLFPISTCDNCLGHYDAALIGLVHACTSYRKLMLFFWPLKITWNLMVMALLVVLIPISLCGTKIVIPGVGYGWRFADAAIDRVFISGPDKLASGIKKLARSRKQPRQLQADEKPFETSAAAFCDKLRKAE